MAEAKKQKVIFCPNCGRLVETQEYYSFQGIAMSEGSSPDPINSRIICSRCNYGGFPLEAIIEEYKQIDFSNWKMLPAPIQTASPTYKFLAKLTILGLSAMIAIILSYYFTILFGILFFLFVIYKLFLEKKSN